jgi:serine phosphatase RsbU (regulator of sigma subunit)
MDTTQDTRRPDDAVETAGGRPATAEKSALYRTFWRKVDAALSAIRPGGDLTSILDEVIIILLSEFRQELHIVAGRLYEKVDDHRYVLRRWRGDNPPDKLGYAVPITYAAVQLLLDRGTLIMKESDPGFDPSIEDPLGVSLFAALMIGEDNRWLLSFSIEGEVDRERMLYMLSTIQHVVGLKIRQQRIHDILEEARLIQLSMLPKGPPTFPPFDIQGRSVPAESVSGDLFDYLPLSDRVLGLAVADASGHGLPAALQARDVITGLRMGMEENLKIVSTVEKLNKVINRSTLATRFVSLFYGELEANGNFIYCSAGHPPGLLYNEGRFTELDLGGLVLGPNPAARYERGYSRVEPGGTVVLYTDGITEAFDRDGQSFGVERLKALIAEHHPLPARALVDRILQAVEAFSRRTPPLDDQTIVVVRRPAPH